MKVRPDYDEVFALTDLDPEKSDIEDREYSGSEAAALIDLLVDAYSGNGNLLLPLDEEAQEYIKAAEENWTR